MSKAYCVKAHYFDGDHDHGFYESPLFAKREDAEQFLVALQVVAEAAPGAIDCDKQWWWEDAWDRPNRGYIIEHEISDSWDGELKSADEYLYITHT